jgi:predicted transcriptional regulator
MNPKIELKIGIKLKIVNYIRLHPGATFKAIQTIFNLSESTLRYYLRDLERKKQIKTENNKRIYYPIERKVERNLSRIQQKLIYHIKNHPGITQKELAIERKLNRLTIRNNINLLVEKQIISINKVGNEIHHYYINQDEYEEKEMVRLITKFLLYQIDEETYWDLREKFLEEKK